MNLDELRKQAEAEEQQEQAETQEVVDLEENELEEEAEEIQEEAESKEEPELEELDLELDGETEAKPKYDPEQALTHKLTKQRKRAQKAESEVESLRAEIDQLKKSIGSQPAPMRSQFEYGSAAPIPPDRYSAEINGDEQAYAAAHAKYLSNWNEWQQAQLAPQRKAEAQQASYNDMISAKANALSTDAKNFITDNKVKAEIVVDAIEVAKEDIDAAAGLDGAFVHLLGSLDSGAAKVAYHLGRSEASRNKLKEIMKQDPSGLKAVSYLTKLTALKPKKQISRAPEPDTPVKGDTTVSASKWQSAYDKATDPQKMLEIRRKARAAGIQLK